MSVTPAPWAKHQNQTTSDDAALTPIDEVEGPPVEQIAQDPQSCADVTVAKLTVVKGEIPARLSKAFRLSPDGEIERLPGGKFSAGACKEVSVANLTVLGDILKRLNPSHALVYGVPVNGATKVMSRKAFEHAGRPPDATTRTKDAFQYPEGAGVLMVDYDPPKDGTAPLDRDGLVAAIRTAVPGLAQCEMLWFPSASSCIYNGDVPLWGVRGQRLYLLVQHAADIPRAGKVLLDRLWLAGHGHFEVSKSGALLDRALIDGSVWQANRLDFAGGAHCTAPLRQDRGSPVLIEGEAAIIDSAVVLADLSLDELDTVRGMKEAAREEMALEVEEAREAWVEARVVDCLTKAERDDPETVEQARVRLRRVLSGGELAGDFLIHVEAKGGFEAVKVATLLENPSRYDRKLTLDPVEPDYGGGRAVGRLFLLQGKPTLHSFAHGGKTYRLNRVIARIQVVGGHTAEAVAQTVEQLRRDALVFDFGEAAVVVDRGRLHVLEENTLALHLGQGVQFWKMDKGNNPYDIDPPKDMLRQTLGLKDRRNLKPLNAVITAPVVLLDGSVLDQPGYHAPSGLFYDPIGQEVQSVPLNPTPEEAQAALTTIMAPFADFPFVDALAKGAMLAALLTAVERPVLPTAPAFAFDAPVQGSGKTLLARCVGSLAEGREPDTFPHTKSRDDEEVRKRLFSALMMGTATLIWDNVTGAFDSAAMAALLTAPVVADRVLGKSQALRLPNRVLLIFTGNNLAFEGDMPRRVIKCRIDPRSATPFVREFAIDPFDHVRTHRLDLVTAACTLIRAYQASGVPRAKGRMASFEDWDDIVRQTVVWVGTALAPNEYCDPMELVREAQAADPVVDALGDLLQALADRFGDAWFTGLDVQKAVDTSFSLTLKDALNDLAGRDISNSARSIGKVLSARKGQIAHGLHLTGRKPNDKDAVSYRVQHEGE
jgi:hypothetical protein